MQTIDARLHDWVDGSRDVGLVNIVKRTLAIYETVKGQPLVHDWRQRGVCGWEQLRCMMGPYSRAWQLLLQHPQLDSPMHQAIPG